MYKKIIISICLILGVSLLCCLNFSKSTKTTVQFASWGSESEISILKPILKDFEKENPDIEIEYEEFYGVCDECKTEIFVPGLDDRNEEIIEEEFRKKRI